MSVDLDGVIKNKSGEYFILNTTTLCLSGGIFNPGKTVNERKTEETKHFSGTQEANKDDDNTSQLKDIERYSRRGS